MSTGKRRRRLRGRPAPTTTPKRKCTDRAHWKKQPCGVCQVAVYYVSALVFPLPLRSQFGDVQIDYPAHTRVCGKCLAANPGAELKVRVLEVAKDTRACHRCGGHGTYLDVNARRWAGTRPGGYGWKRQRTVVAKVKCKPCDGTGRVPA